MSAGMHIGVVSDSHGSQLSLERALEAMQPIDLLLHAGDYCRDAKVFAQKHRLQVETVRGNCDMEFNIAEEQVLHLLGHTILLTHGHRYNVKRTLDELCARAEKVEADVCVFGHSHVPLLEKIGQCLFVNPGSPYVPRTGIPTCANLYVERGMAPQAWMHTLTAQM